MTIPSSLNSTQLAPQWILNATSEVPSMDLVCKSHPPGCREKGELKNDSSLKTGHIFVQLELTSINRAYKDLIQRKANGYVLQAIVGAQILKNKV